MKKLLRKLLIILIPLISINLPVFSEEDTLAIIKSEIEKSYSVNFEDSYAVLNSGNKILPESVKLQGYGELGARGQKLARETAFSDLKRNYLNFLDGIYFEFNSDNDLVLKNSDTVNIPKSPVKEQILSDTDIYMVEIKLTIPKNTRNYSRKLPSVIAIGFSEMASKKNILEAYNEARNMAIIKGLKLYYGDSKVKRRGKLIFQKILYNSLDSEVKNPAKFVYVLQFGVDETK